MAQKTSVSLVTDLTTHPAHLITGSRTQTVDALIAWMQQHWCKHKGCLKCPTCLQIQEKIHHQLFWAAPTPNYNLEQIDEIIAHTSFMIDEDQDFFIVLENADNLSPACGNRLLKILEEPPRGYHFILLSERPRALLPTIHSRCLHTSLEDNSHAANQHPLVAYFSKFSVGEPDLFLKLIDEQEINEKEALDLIDTLLCYWIEQHTIHILNNEEKKTKQSAAYVSFFKTALENPPMPGGVKILWKNVYLKINNSL